MLDGLVYTHCIMLSVNMLNLVMLSVVSQVMRWGGGVYSQNAIKIRFFKILGCLNHQMVTYKIIITVVITPTWLNIDHSFVNREPVLLAVLFAYSKWTLASKANRKIIVRSCVNASWDESFLQVF
jgi:hypothetical protein